MKLVDTLEEAVTALSANKVRSGLTVLGIVIGIASVISLVSVGQGTKQSVEASIESIGSNLIQVQPGIQRGGPVSQGRGSASRSLKPDDATAIAELPDAAAVAGELSGRYQITTKGANTNTQVIGTVPEYAQVRNIEMAEGSFINAEQARSASRVAVIGPNVRDDLFGAPSEGGQDPIGQTVRVRNVAVKIIGVTKAKGGLGFNSPDDSVFVPLGLAQRSLAGGSYPADRRWK